MSKSVAVLLAESLEAHGVDRIFCVPGESYVGMTSILVERGSPEVIVCRHESGAGFMALADSELTGRAGVAIVSRGPGVSNAMVSLHSAYHDATPMVLLIGHVERRDVGRGALQEQNYARLLSTSPRASSRLSTPTRPRRPSRAPFTRPRAPRPARSPSSCLRTSSTARPTRRSMRHATAS